MAKTTEKTAKDLGQAAVDLADKAGNGLQDATHKASAGGQDAWITTKVKSALTSDGLDPLHIHVDTEGEVVTLSGSVDSAANREKAVSVARHVTGVLGVKDHLFVKADTR
ncbi:MAG TPA: BON domain-containing protein [Polyangia bacterium]|nr:BON domain-containing protein [Polyangia bacterium]